MNVRQPGFFCRNAKINREKKKLSFALTEKHMLRSSSRKNILLLYLALLVCFNAYQAEPKQIYDLPSSELMDSNLGLAATQLLSVN